MRRFFYIIPYISYGISTLQRKDLDRHAVADFDCRRQISFLTLLHRF